MSPQHHINPLQYYNLAFNHTEVAKATAFSKTIIGSLKVIRCQNIFKNNRSNTMRYYELYVHNYNKQLPELNNGVLQYNSLVYNNTNTAKRDAETLKFNALMGKVSTHEYNAAVQAYNNAKEELLVLKKEYMPIKKPLQATFQALLLNYSYQIDTKNKRYKTYNIPTARTLDKMAIDHHHMSELELNNVRILPYTKRTVQNHVARLRDAGLLIAYEFRGSKKPVNYHINPQILEVYCQETKKNTIAENQIVISPFEKNLPNKTFVTRTNNNINTIGNVDNQHFRSGKDVCDAIASNKNINKNTNLPSPPKKSSSAEANQGPAKKFTEYRNPKTEILRKEIYPVPKLCQKLEYHDFDDYRFGFYDALETESISGTMPKTEFRTLLLQQMLIIAASLWKNLDVFTGVWINAYNILEQYYFKNPNGSIPNKLLLLQMFSNYQKRLKMVRDYQKKHNYSPLIPQLYFMPQLKNKGSGGFAVTAQWLQKQGDYKRERQKFTEKLKKQAQVQNYNAKARQLIYKQIELLISKKKTIQQVDDYIQNNARIPVFLKKNWYQNVENHYKNA